jgi:hypothetical protein
MVAPGEEKYVFIDFLDFSGHVEIPWGGNWHGKGIFGAVSYDSAGL